MGLEATTKVTMGGQTAEARVQAEPDHILIRSADMRVKVAPAELTGVTARDGVLHLDFPGGPAAIHLGEPTAANWARKILNPPSRRDKLGIKPGKTIYADGTFDTGFEDDAPERDAKPTNADILFVEIVQPPELKKAIDAGRKMPTKSAIWVVYPKGRKDTVTEMQVLEGMRAAGFTDIKVCGFNKTLTALKFVHAKAR